MSVAYIYLVDPNYKADYLTAKNKPRTQLWKLRPRFVLRYIAD